MNTNDHDDMRANSRPAAFGVAALAVAIAVGAILSYLIPLLEELRTSTNTSIVDAIVASVYLISFCALIAAEIILYATFRAGAGLLHKSAQTEERYHRLLEAVPMAVLLEQRDMVSYANPAAAKLFGAALPGDIVGKPLVDLVHPDRRVGFSMRLSALRDGLETGSSREKMLRLDDSETDVDIVPSLIDAGGESAVMLVLNDVSARLRAETAARREQDRLDMITRATNDVVYDWDMVNDTVWWNENFSSAFGHSQNSTPSDEHWSALIHDDDRRRVLDGIRAATAGEGTFWADEYRFRKSDGTYADIYNRGYIDRDETKKAVRMVGAMVDLTDRKKMTESLTQTKALLERAQEAAHVGSWFSDPAQEGKLIWSDEVYHIFGLSRAVFDGKVETFFKMIHPNDLEAVKAASAAALESGASYDLDHRIVRPDGTIRWVHERADVTRDLKGKPVQMIGVVQDITARKLAEREVAMQFEVAKILAESPALDEARPRILSAVCQHLDWTTGAVWLPDPDGETIRCNTFWRNDIDPALDAFEAISRRSTYHRDESLIGRVWTSATTIWETDILRDKAFMRAREAIAGGLRGGIAIPIIVDGVVEAVYEFFSDTVEREEAQITTTLESIAKHISLFVQRKNIEAQRERSERYARAIIDSSTDLISVVDADGIIREGNRAAQRILGHRSDELIGKRSADLIHPDDLPRVIEGFAAGMKDPSQRQSAVYRFKKADGGWVWLDSEAVNLLGDPSVNGILIFSRDATDRIESERRIGELDLLKNKFIQIVSHQIRTPLNAVRWNLETLLAEELGPLATAQKEFMRVTYEANNNVIERIRDVLTALDIEEGRIILTPEPSSVESIWGSVMTDMQRKCAIKGITCTYTAPATPIPAAAIDAAKIRTVFGKLADNAVAYTRTGGTISTSLSAKDGRVRFEITDTGIGIPAVEQGRLFERFFRATNASTMLPDASGLGLAIARHFTEQHGGTLNFTSLENKGSSFWAEFPLHAKGTPKARRGTRQAKDASPRA